MRRIVLGLALCSCGSGTPPSKPPLAVGPRNQPKHRPAAAVDRATVVRILERFAFGPGRGQVDAVVAQGPDVWFEQQMTMGSEPVSPAYRDATLPPLELVEAMGSMDMVEGGADESVSVKSTANGRKTRAAKDKVKINFRRLAERLTMAQLTRHVGSDHQVVEVMVDFWSNHFNVFARKGNVKLYAGHYLEHAIRPHVLGRFEDLVIATARHPAMLLYLDNAKSRAPRTGRALKRAQQRNAKRMANNKKPRRRRDLNENYARELLELHTVGMNHTQADIVGVARVLTGWGVRALQDGGGFMFRQGVHDGGTKSVLGRTFGPGEQAGRDMLRFLARHPATAQHLGAKLCIRFVSDVPPPACVEAVAEAHQKTGGDIPAMLRAVYGQVRSNAGVTKKMKTPLEFLVSSLRILDAKPSNAKLARALKKLGQPTMMMSVPTGYAEVASAWNGSTSMLRRMDIAAALGRGRLKGADVDLDRLFPKGTPNLVASINHAVLNGRASAATLAAIRAQVDGVRQPKRARRIALTLALGSPEFLSQ